VHQLIRLFEQRHAPSETVRGRPGRAELSAEGLGVGYLVFEDFAEFSHAVLKR